MPPPCQPDFLPHSRMETRRSAGQIPLELTLFDLPPHQDPDPVSNNFVLCLALRGTVHADFRFGDCWRRAIVPPGTFMPITPPRTLGELAIDAPHRHLMLALPMQAVTEIDRNQTEFGPLHSGAFRDRLVAQLCMELWEEAKSGNAAGDLFADCARAALVAALTRRAGQKKFVKTPMRAEFSPEGWARIAREIDARLDQPMTVAMLAALADMRETRFLHAFKRQTGMSPYRYVLHKRLERATGMLTGSSVPLAEVALATGFADQAHMTASFARHYGRTPGEVRRTRH